MGFWDNTPFFDLEPFLGSSDHLWDDMVNEIDQYPHRYEVGYLSVPGMSKFLMRTYLRNGDDVSKRKNHNITYGGPPQQWDSNWPVKDSRITLVEQREKDGQLIEGAVVEERLQYFPKLWQFISSLPIKRHYRTNIIIGSPHCALPKHVDWKGLSNPITEEKIHTLFINPRNNRSFYYVKNDRRYYTNSSLYMFNNGTAEHGINAEVGKSALIRLYCALDDDFCRRSGIYVVA